MATRLDKEIANYPDEVYFIKDPEDGHFILLNRAEFYIFIEQLIDNENLIYEY